MFFIGTYVGYFIKGLLWETKIDQVIIAIC